MSDNSKQSKKVKKYIVKCFYDDKMPLVTDVLIQQFKAYLKNSLKK